MASIDEALALGRRLHQMGDLLGAEAMYRQIVAVQPTHALTWFLLGKICKDVGRLDEARDCYQESIRHNSGMWQAHNNLGNVLLALKKPEESVECFRRALTIDVNCADAYNGLGAAAFAMGKADEAVENFRSATQLDPSFNDAFNGLAAGLLCRRNLSEAIDAFRQAIRLCPNYAEAHRNLAMALLAIGDFREGWREYEWRLRCADFAHLPIRPNRWDGSPMPGRTLLLSAEQGLGDVLHFIRFAPLVKQRCGSLVFECPASLVPLLQRSPGIDRLIARGSPLPPFDASLPLLSVPGVLGATLESIPSDVPYVFPDDQLVEHWRNRLASFDGFKVGIAWQGSPTMQWDRFRSIPLEQFAVLAAVDQVRLISLQKGLGTEQIEPLRDRFPLVDFNGQIDEQSGPFMDTAAIMKNLDLVVTSDTSIAHLAGSLGVPVWIALDYAAEWRWLTDREDSPWYPTMRLFRQTELGQWDGVFAKVAAALGQRVTQRQ